ncbi:MAG: hypothetical protein WC843_06515 [Candidatus Gracilibacteria bacterium]|jgi:hypothetical protein
MKKLLVLSLTVLALTGCTQQVPAVNQDISQPKTSVNQPITNAKEPIANVNTQVANPAPADNQAPQIISAIFDGNGIVIQGKNLSDSYVAFNAPPSRALCQEMITPSCVLQKAVATDTTIKFISNSIGSPGSYQIYVENKTTGKSNVVKLTIPVPPAK